MNEKDLIKYIKKIASSNDVQILKENQYKVTVPADEIYNVLTRFKNEGYKHLSLISATDWINDDKFELVYIIYSYVNHVSILVSIFIDRKEAKADTIKFIWPIASTYEREIYEMFGIEFVGNDDRRPFVLEGWKGMPPMRKDFDLNKYSNKKFDRRKYA